MSSSFLLNASTPTGDRLPRCSMNEQIFAFCQRLKATQPSSHVLLSQLALMVPSFEEQKKDCVPIWTIEI